MEMSEHTIERPSIESNKEVVNDFSNVIIVTVNCHCFVGLLFLFLSKALLIEKLTRIHTRHTGNR